MAPWWTFLATALAALATASKPEEIRVLRVASGQDSFRQAPGVAIARDRTEFLNAWMAQFGSESTVTGGYGAPAPVTYPQPPNINFDEVMVVALFGGNTTPTNYRLASAKDEGEFVRLRFTPQPLSGTLGLGVVTRPWAFFFLTRSKKEVRVEVPGQQGWVQVAASPAPATAQAAGGRR